MKLSFSTSLALLCLFLAPSGADACLFGNPGKGKIIKALRAPAMTATNYGIKVVDLSSGKTLIDENSAKLFVPASTLKIVTAYAALKLLSPQYAFATQFSAESFVDSTTVTTLCIKGYGDPSTSLADLNYQALAISGKIRHVTGDILIDTSYFDTVPFGHGWMWDEGIVSWNAPIAPYSLKGNCVDIYARPGRHEGDPVQIRSVPDTAYALLVSSAVTGSCDSLAVTREELPCGDRFIVSGTLTPLSPERHWTCTVSKPGIYAGTVFKELLTGYSTTVNGGIYEGAASSSAFTINNYLSRNLIDVLRAFLKESDNFTGECLLKTLGAKESCPPGDAAKGINAIKKVLAEKGIPEKTYVLADGSGLSTYNQLSPAILTAILQAAHDDFSLCPEFLDSLSIAGRDGTLKDRLGKSPLAGTLRAKTGTMSGVSCLSGYLQTKRGHLLAVTLMMNGCAGTVQPLKNVQDEILQVLWENY